MGILLNVTPLLLSLLEDTWGRGLPPYPLSVSGGLPGRGVNPAAGSGGEGVSLCGVAAPGREVRTSWREGPSRQWGRDGHIPSWQGPGLWIGSPGSVTSWLCDILR